MTLSDDRLGDEIIFRDRIRLRCLGGVRKDEFAEKTEADNFCKDADVELTGSPTGVRSGIGRRRGFSMIVDDFEGPAAEQTMKNNYN